MRRSSTARPRLLLSRLLPVGAGLLLPSVLFGQTATHAFGTGAQFQYFSFSEGLGAEAASLTMIPLAYSLPVGRRFDMDLYAAYANGSVDRGGLSYGLQGFVDTRLRARWQMAPWAVLTAMVNLPTGNSSHDPEEAVVASVLSTDILGFREANWGTGTAVTGGLVTARQAGDWGIGFGVSYRMANGFEPSTENDLVFEPGDEIRVRFGLDRNVGQDGKFTAGVTFQNFSEDQYDSRNLFQAGNRFRFDASYAFRSGRSTWAFYAVNVWREAGDAFLDMVNPQGTVVGDTTVVVGSQNLAILGVNGSTPLGGSFRIRPSLDFRYQSREEGSGEGWIVGAGADVPLGLLGTYDLFPRARFMLGSMKGASGASANLWGLEAGLTFRWQNR